MIPYDDLVAALTNWRARQGLPVSQLATPGSGNVAAPLSSSGSSGAFGAASSSGSGPARTAPPNAPPRGYSTNPPPFAEPAAPDVGDLHDDPLDVDDAALLEEASFDHEDDGMRYAGVQTDGEATSIGGAPDPRDSFGGPTKPGRDNGDW